jgi:hypothetical protein
MKKLVGLFVMSLLLTVTIAGFLIGRVTIDKAQGQTSGFVCPVEDIANTGCTGPKDCLYPNPGSCNNFIQCTPNADGTGTPVLTPCPSSLEWNDNKKECDLPDDGTCNRS